MTFADIFSNTNILNRQFHSLGRTDIVVFEMQTHFALNIFVLLSFMNDLQSLCSQKAKISALRLRSKRFFSRYSPYNTGIAVSIVKKNFNWTE